MKANTPPKISRAPRRTRAASPKKSNYGHAYIVFARLAGIAKSGQQIDLTRDCSSAEIATAVEILDESVSSLVPKDGFYRSAVVGGFCVIPNRPQLAVNIAREWRTACASRGVAIALGISRGTISITQDLKSWNTAGTPINLAARLAFLKDEDKKYCGTGRIAVDAAVHDLFLQAGVISPETVDVRRQAHVKKTALTWHWLVESPDPLLPVQDLITKRERDYTDLPVVVYDLEGYSSLTGDLLTAAANNLTAAVSHAITAIGYSVGTPELWYSPAGDGGALIFGSGEVRHLWTFADYLLRHADASQLNVRVGLHFGAVVLAGTPERPVGVPVFIADALSARPPANAIAFSNEVKDCLKDEDTREWDISSGSPDGYIARRKRKGPSGDDIEQQDPRVPQAIRDHIDKLANSNIAGPRILAALAELAHAEQTNDSPYVIGWPSSRDWIRHTLEALSQQIVEISNVQLNLGELVLTVGTPFLISHLMKSQFDSIFGARATKEDNESHIASIIASNPTIERVLSLGIPEPGRMMAVRWAHTRYLHDQRRVWLDTFIRGTCPDCKLATELSANQSFPSLIRALAGTTDDFDALPELASLQLANERFDIRWRLLACLLTLAEARVPTGRLLRPDAVEHAAQLSDVAAALETQFDGITIHPVDHRWVIRAVCDEPVMDYAIRGMAEELDAELRSHRSKMSTYYEQAVGRTFPNVRAEPSPNSENGRPRYTLPHVTFALSSDHARKLFMGGNLWNDPTFAYRELFQNALDACRWRSARSANFDVPYEGYIEIYHGFTNDGREYVECQDNGIGMDRAIISQCFATAGRRFVETAEYRREKEIWKHRRIRSNVNSQFGIGVFSYFLIANELEVETARLAPDGVSILERILLRVPTASSFFRIVSLDNEEARRNQNARRAERNLPKLERLQAGTRVRLWLRRERRRSEEITTAPTSCVDALREHIWFSDVHVVASDYRGNRLEICAGQLAPWLNNTIMVPGEGAQFWWCSDPDVLPLDSKRDLTSVSVTRSRARRGAVADSSYYSSLGRVLVDGIATNASTPGFIVNFTGSDSPPRLSLDRRKILADISSVLERRVLEAVDAIPMQVPESVLWDLWYFDPRICHRINESLVSGARTYYSNDVSSSTDRDGAPTTIVHRRKAFCPWKAPASTSSITGDYPGRLMRLCELVRRMPDAREQTSFVLEERKVDYEFRLHLKNIPDVIWEEWQRVELGIPEAAALEGPWPGDSPSGIPLYMSWLSGMPPYVCAERLQQLIELFDLQCKVIRPVSRQYESVDIRDAYLLSRGHLTSSWINGEVTTADALVFANRSGASVERIAELYEDLGKRLEWPSNVDIELAQEIGELTDDEVWVSVRLLERDLWPFRSAISLPRLELIARSVGLDTANLERIVQSTDSQNTGSSLSLGNLAEEDDVIVRQIQSSLVNHAQIDLAVLCEIADAVKGSLQDVAPRVRRAASLLNKDCVWDHDAVEEVARFSYFDWALIGDPPGYRFGYTRRLISPPTKKQLAIAFPKYYYGFENGAAVLRRVHEIVALFDWSETPITLADVEYAMGLSQVHATLLQKAPTSSCFSIPRLVVLSATEGMPLHEIYKALPALAIYGVVGPEPGATYLGLRWETIAANPIGAVPH